MRYALKAVDAADRVVELDLYAHDEGAARALATQRGYTVFSARRRWEWAAVLRQKPGFPTLLFSIELLALLDAGLNAVEALQVLAEKEEEPQARTVLAGLLGALQRGQPLSQAFEAFPQFFPAVYVATIRSSERTGNLKDALSRFVAYEEEATRIRRKVASALLYPAILTLAGAGVMAFLVFYVVPRFARVYEDVSTPLPVFSAALLSVGSWVGRNLPLVLTLCVALVSLTLYLVSTERVRAMLARRLWDVPKLGQRLRIYHLASLYRSVAMLLRAGIPVLRALEMVRGLLPLHLRDRLSQATSLLAEGRALSVALTAAGLATPIATRLLAVGERSGGLGERMERIARFYDDETWRFTDAFLRVFEPLLMAALGVSVGVVVLLMYMPVFELAGSLQ